MNKAKKFKALFRRFTNDMIVSWLFFFLLSQFGKTPYETWELLLISGIFSISLFSFIAIAIIAIKKDEA